jgi:serine protease Do
MSTVIEPSEETRVERKSPNPAWFILITVLVALLAFWIGHQFWPSNKVTSSIPAPSTTTPHVQPLPLHLGDTALGEHTIADIATRAAASVVNINTKTSVTVPDSSFQFGLPGGFDFFFGPGMQGSAPRRYESFGTGSGVIIREDGYILTNNHVVGKATDIRVTLNDKKVFKGHVVGRDSFTDLALVKIDTANLPVAKFGSTKELRPGDWAIAIGSPLGLDHTVTLGIISALGRSLGELNNNVALIQTDAAINPGNSGGPLLNIHGEVIGINTAIRSGAQNIGFAIPVDVASEVVKGLLNGGKISRPYLGLYMQDIEPQIAKSLGLGEKNAGVIVAKVSEGSPAADAGLQQGDIIQKIDGAEVRTAKEVQAIVRKHNPGDTLNMAVLRGGALRAIGVRIGEYPIESGDDSEDSP